MNIKEYINKIIRKRGEKLIDMLKQFDLELSEYYIAGNSLNNKKINDIDIFPFNKTYDFKPTPKNSSLISETKNARTYEKDNLILQICNYYHNNLKELVQSFDYAHIQVGITVISDVVTDVYFTDDYIKANVTNNSYYLGSKYPLSSLIRAGKYSKKNDMSKGKMIYSSLLCLIDIIERGFKDYEDFKDQLDAVDLGLVPEEMDEVASKDLIKLFHQLEK